MKKQSTGEIIVVHPFLGRGFAWLRMASHGFVFEAGDRSESLQSLGNLWKPMEHLWEICGKSMGNLWASVETYGSYGIFMEIDG